MKKTKLGTNIIQGLNDVIEYEKGRKILPVTSIEIPDPPPTWHKKQIIDLRKNVFKVSQPVFAALLNVKPSTVKAWEQGLKKPSSAAMRLLQIISTFPHILSKLNNIN
ncbi:MAG: transcriptional regulator [bacterium]|nr:transcriptional regulator [bacterium]MBU1918693.1 transcriptional regulator [bacterium]